MSLYTRNLLKCGSASRWRLALAVLFDARTLKHLFETSSTERVKFLEDILASWATCRTTPVALCFLWYRRLSLLHPTSFHKNGLSQSKDRPWRGGGDRREACL